MVTEAWTERGDGWYENDVRDDDLVPYLRDDDYVAYVPDGGPRIPGEPTSDGCDVNPICGCHIRALCRGCGTCTTCDNCYCGED